jgi:hypothetical protein
MQTTAAIHIHENENVLYIKNAKPDTENIRTLNFFMEFFTIFVNRNVDKCASSE